MAPNTSDFIKDTRLEIEVFADHTIQTTFVSNPTTGQRRTQVHERWQRTKELGHGSFGVVRLEECTTGPSLGELRAVKELRKGTVDVSPNYYKELEAIAKFSQERYRDHFVRSFGWYEDNSTVFITMEYLPLGDLEGYLKTPLSHIEARQITKQLLEGLEFMHDNNFAHRDVKPSNVLVLHKGPEWWVKVADFGISKRVDDTVLRTIIGTEAYLAPEVRGLYTDDSKEADENTFSFAVDIWAIGAISFRMVTGRLAFPPGRKLFDYVRGSPFPIEEPMIPEYAKFITETMAASPRHRPTSKQALSYKWIQMEEILFPVLDSKSTTSQNLDTKETIAPIASAQWSTWNETLPTLRIPSAIKKTQHPFMLQQIQRLERGAWAVAFSPDGRRLASSSTQSVLIWEWDGQGRLQQVQQLEQGAYAVAFSPKGRWLASGSGDGDKGILIWEVDKQGKLQQAQKLKSHGPAVESVAFSPDGRRLASGCGKAVLIWEADGQDRLQQAQKLEHDGIEVRSGVSSLAFSPDGRSLASVGRTRAVLIWEVDGQGRLRRAQRLEGHGDCATSVAFSPDGRQVASGGLNGAVLIWEADGQGRLQQIQRLKEADGMKVMSLTFSPDGRRLASGGEDKAVLIWEVDGQGKLQEAQKLEGHMAAVKSVTFSPNGRRLMSLCREAILIWDAN